MPFLEFQNQVERHFGFLIGDHGYRWTESTPYRVRFESPTVFIEVGYDGQRSYEIGLLIGKVGSDSPPLNLDEILRLRRAPVADSFSLVQVSTLESLSESLEKMAAVLRTYAGDFIAGKDDSFIEATEHRRLEVHNYTLERKLRIARSESEAAWRRKDYASVVKALKPLRAALNATEVGKLEFAENKCRK